MSDHEGALDIPSYFLGPDLLPVRCWVDVLYLIMKNNVHNMTKKAVMLF